MSNTPLHSVSVAGVTFDDAGQVLVIKRRDNGEWQAPGGVLELGETLETGVIREVLEETGVHVDVERLSGIYKNLRLGVVALVFRCRPRSGVPRPTSESEISTWLDLEQALNGMTSIFGRRVQDAANVHLTEPVIAYHDGVRWLP